MAKSQKQKREDALDLYLNTDITQKQICNIIGWSERTFTTNKDKYGWKALKEAESISTKKILANLYKQAFELSKADKVDADKLVKLAKTIEALSDNKVTLSHYINCFKGFTRWLIDKDKETARTVNQLQQEFVIDLQNQGGDL
jgi:hypothetical protein